MAVPEGDKDCHLQWVTAKEAALLVPSSVALQQGTSAESGTSSWGVLGAVLSSASLNEDLLVASRPLEVSGPRSYTCHTMYVVGLQMNSRPQPRERHTFIFTVTQYTNIETYD